MDAFDLSVDAHNWVVVVVRGNDVFTLGMFDSEETATEWLKLAANTPLFFDSKAYVRPIMAANPIEKG